MKLAVIFEVPDDQAEAYADVAARMIQHHAFSEQQGIKHWSFDQEMRPVAAIVGNTWKTPDPPDEEITTLVGESGREYQRSTADGLLWHSDAPGQGRGTYHWSDLLWADGPLTAKT